MSGPLLSTKLLLAAWGQWGAMSNIGYPKGSAEFVERTLKTPLFPNSYAPPDVLEVDAAVCKLEPLERQLLIHKFQWRTPWRQDAAQFGWSRYTYYTRLNDAIYAVHVALG